MIRAGHGPGASPVAPSPPIALVHGAATTARVWRHVVDALLHAENAPEVVAIDRPMSGSLERELDHLRRHCAGSFVVGVSGGATLGWALLSRAAAADDGSSPIGALLHEPAAGSLAPGLLDQVAVALEEGGVAGFSAELYGPSWTTAETGADEATVRREFGMFRAFEPAPIAPWMRESVTLSAGVDSSAARHRSVKELARRFGVSTLTVPGRHAVHLESPVDFAQAVIATYRLTVSPA